MVFDEGIILYFDPFYFKNGNKAKQKYFVVLKNIGSKTVLASLPSSQDFVPSSYIDPTNFCKCIDIPNANFNCYFFPENVIITTNNWFFPKKTYLYGHQIDEYDTNNLLDIYPLEGIDYEIKGLIKPTIFQDLLHCFRNSPSVKNKFKKVL